MSRLLSANPQVALQLSFLKPAPSTMGSELENCLISPLVEGVRTRLSDAGLAGSHRPSPCSYVNQDKYVPWGEDTALWQRERLSASPSSDQGPFLPSFPWCSWRHDSQSPHFLTRRSPVWRLPISQADLCTTGRKKPLLEASPMLDPLFPQTNLLDPSVQCLALSPHAI